MLNKIIRFSLENRILVLVASVLLVIAGLYSTSKTDVDVFPDLNAPTVVIMTEAGGMATSAARDTLCKAIFKQPDGTYWLLMNKLRYPDENKPDRMGVTMKDMLALGRVKKLILLMKWQSSSTSLLIISKLQSPSTTKLHLTKALKTSSDLLQLTQTTHR